MSLKVLAVFYLSTLATCLEEPPLEIDLSKMIFISIGITIALLNFVMFLRENVQSSRKQEKKAPQVQLKDEEPKQEPNGLSAEDFSIVSPKRRNRKAHRLSDRRKNAQKNTSQDAQQNSAELSFDM